MTVVGSPVDVTRVPLVAPLRPLLNLPFGRGAQGRGAITRAYQAMGGAPKPLVKWAFQLSSFQKLVTKPLAVAQNLDDADFLAQLEAVDRFTDNMIAYPGRTFGQLYHRFVKGNALVGGEFELGDRTISLAAITAPVLVFGGATDGIAPIAAVKAVVPLLTGAAEARFEIVPGGHLGMLTGRAARGTTWQVMDEWIDQWSSDDAADAAPARTRQPSKGTIGSNPKRRYGSAGSRSLGELGGSAGYAGQAGGGRVALEVAGDHRDALLDEELVAGQGVLEGQLEDPVAEPRHELGDGQRQVGNARPASTANSRSIAATRRLCSRPNWSTAAFERPRR